MAARAAYVARRLKVSSVQKSWYKQVAEEEAYYTHEMPVEASAAR